MASSCVKCSRELEPDLSGSPSKQCLLCIGEGIDLLGMLQSIDRGGLREASSEAKCGICSRAISTGDQSVKSDYGHICGSCYNFFQAKAGAPIPQLINQADKWIVKSSLNIIGPFTEERILNGIKAREFASLDEVCEPRRLWRYIRDTKCFVEILQETTVKDFREDNTVDITKSMTASQFGTDPGVFTKKDSKVVDVKYNENLIGNINSKGGSKLSIGKLPLGLAAGIVVLVGFFAFMAGQRNQPNVEEFSIDNSKSKLAKYWNKGLYSKYKSEAREIEMNGFELKPLEKIQLAAIKLEEGDLTGSKYILDQHQDTKHKVEYELLRTKYVFKTKSPKEAFDYINKLPMGIRIDERAMLNSSYLALLSGNLRMSEKLLLANVSLESLNSNRAIIDLLFKIKSKYEFSKKEILEQSRSLDAFADARPSLNLLQAVILYKNEYKQDASKKFFQAISLYPEPDKSHRQNLYMIPYSDRYSQIEKLFKNIELKDESLDLAVQSLIAHKLNDNPKAVRKIKQATRVNSGRSLLEAWVQFLTTGEIASTPKMITPDYLELTNPFVLGFVAEKCLKNEKLDCAKKVLSKVLSEDHKDIRSRYNMIMLQEKLGNNDEAMRHFKTGLGIAPRYIPFLLIEDRYL